VVLGLQTVALALSGTLAWWLPRQRTAWIPALACVPLAVLAVIALPGALRLAPATDAFAEYAPWRAAIPPDDTVWVAGGMNAAGFVWFKPLTEFDFYYNTLAVTLAVAYMAALAAFVRVMFTRHPFGIAVMFSGLPMMALAVLAYLLYSAGVAPAEEKDLYQAWYIGAGVLGSGLVLVLMERLRRPAEPKSVTAG